MKAWRFFLTVYIYSWILWGLAIATQKPVSNSVTVTLFLLGGLGPTIGWIVVAKSKGETNILKRLLEAIKFNTLGIIGITVAVGLATIPMILSWITINDGTSFDIYPITSITTVLFLLIVSVVEETGWRGYAYPELNSVYSPFVSSIIVGVFWSLWHLPLAFIVGTYQYGLGLFSQEFYLFFFLMIPNSVVYGWLQGYSNQNVASAVLYHTFTNLIGEVFGFTGKSDLMRTFVITILAILFGVKMI